MDDNHDFIKTALIALTLLLVYLLLRDSISSFVDWVFQRQIENVLSKF